MESLAVEMLDMLGLRRTMFLESIGDFGQMFSESAAIISQMLSNL